MSETSTNGLHFYEDEILKVVRYEQDTLQVKKWDGSNISLDEETDTNTAGYCRAEATNFPPDELEQCNILLIMKYVSLWDFSSDNAGWSSEERDTELGIEANLVDPSVAWEIKNIYLIHYRDALVPLLLQDHRLSPPPTTRLLRGVPPILHHDEVPNTYFTDRDAGLYKDFKTGAGEIYNAECTTLWKELRRDGIHATLDDARATIKKTMQDEDLRLRSTASIETLQEEIRVLKKQNEARAREIRIRNDRIRELEAAPDNHEDAE